MSKPPPPPPGIVDNVTTANTTVTGTANLETINAQADHDTLIAGPGYEYLNAGSSNDTLEGAIGSVTFAGLAGSTNSSLIALSDPNVTLPGVDISLAGGFVGAGTTVTGTSIIDLAVTNQTQFFNNVANIDNVTVNNNGDNALTASSHNGSVLIVNGNGNNVLTGGGGNDSLTVNGSGINFFWDAGGTNTMTGGSGQNYYYEELGHAASKWLNANYYHNTITDFSVASDTLEFQIASGVSQAPTSWSLITVNGVQALHAVLGDGVSTLTLLGVTDPSHIHMEGIDGATHTIVQLADVPLAGAAPLANVNTSLSLFSASDVHHMHFFG